MNFASMPIGKKLGLSFGVIVALMIVLSVFSIYKMYEVSRVVETQTLIRTEKLERLYLVREALAQTGLAARNAYIFTDTADANRELDILDRQKTIYLTALDKVTPLLRNDPQFSKVRQGLLTMAEELKRPRQFRDSGSLQAYGEFLVNECSPLRRQIVEDLELLIESLQKQVDDGTAEIENTFIQAEVVIALLTALVVELQ